MNYGSDTAEMNLIPMVYKGKQLAAKGKMTDVRSREMAFGIGHRLFLLRKFFELEGDAVLPTERIEVVRISVKTQTIVVLFL
jgi:hypothetical protein